MTPSKLKVKETAGAGFEIQALIDEPVDCVEGDHYQKVAGEPGTQFIPFIPGEWTETVEKLFGEMVDAWNEKHGEADDQV